MECLHTHSSRRVTEKNTRLFFSRISSLEWFFLSFTLHHAETVSFTPHQTEAVLRRYVASSQDEQKSTIYVYLIKRWVAVANGTWCQGICNTLRCWIARAHMLKQQCNDIQFWIAQAFQCSTMFFSLSPYILDLVSIQWMNEKKTFFFALVIAIDPLLNIVSSILVQHNIVL